MLAAAFFQLPGDAHHFTAALLRRLHPDDFLSRFGEVGGLHRFLGVQPGHDGTCHERNRDHAEQGQNDDPADDGQKDASAL